MARQIITTEVRQQHSGGDLTVELTYTSDGVVVKRLSRKVSIKEGQTLDTHLALLELDTAVARAKAWAQQGRLF